MTLTEYGDFRGQSRRSVWENLRDATRDLALQCPFGQVLVDTADEGALIHGYELLGIGYDIAD